MASVGNMASIQYRMATVAARYGTRGSNLFGYSSALNRTNRTNKYNSYGYNNDAMSQILNSKRDYFQRQYDDLYNKIYGNNKTDNSSSSDSQAFTESLKEVSAGLKGAANDVANYAKGLKYGEAVNTEEAQKYIQSYVDNYNSFIDKVGDSNDQATLQKGVDMVNTTNSYKGALNRVGITVGSNNKLSFNKNNTSNLTVSNIRLAFGENSSYASKVSKTAGNLAQNVSSGSSGKNDALNSLDSGEYLTSLRNTSSEAGTAAKDLIKYAQGLKYGGKLDVAEARENIQSFVDNYNSYLDKVAESNDQSVLQEGVDLVRNAKYLRNSLSKVGISINGSNQLSFNEKAISENSVSNIKRVFGNNGGLAARTLSSAKTFANISSSSGSASSGTSSSTDKADDSDYIASLKSAVDDVKNVTSDISAYTKGLAFGASVDTAEAGKQIKSFVDSYNGFIDKVSQSGSSSIRQKGTDIARTANVYSSMLNRVGISVGKDNKLSFNEDKLPDITAANLKTAFTGSSSFASKLAQKAQQAGSLAGSAGMYSYDKSSTQNYAYTAGALFSTYV